MVAVAAAVTAAAAVGSAAYSASQQSGGGGGKPKPQNIPEPPYARALNHDVARMIALNMGQQAPSFAQYVGSGGTATFPLIDPGMTPQERKDLGLIGPGNTPVPTTPRASAPGKSLSLDEYLYMGHQQASSKNPEIQNSPAARFWRMNQQMMKAESRPQTAGRQKKEAKLTNRMDAFKRKHNLGAGEGA